MSEADLHIGQRWATADREAPREVRITSLGINGEGALVVFYEIKLPPAYPGKDWDPGYRELASAFRIHYPRYI